VEVDGVEGEAALAALIADLDHQEVVALLRRAAMEHEDVARLVRLAASSDADRLQLLRATVDQGLRTRRFLDYWASSRWAGDAAPVVDALRAEASQRQSRELVVLVERAVGHVVKVILNADDSNGQIGSLARDLLDVHVELCDTGVADPVALAKWMVRFTFDDQDFFVVDPVRYATALGEAGLATYRSEVAKRSTGAGDGERSFAASYAIERLAIIDRDVPTLVEVLGGDLTRPHQFGRVAEAMLELDDPDAALAWARRGIGETSGWQVAKLYDVAATIVAERGDKSGVFDLRLHEHERLPSASTYSLLKTAAESIGSWENERSAARLVLEQRSPSAYVDALLADNDTAEAWTAVVDNPDWQLDERQWERLATAREPDDPAASFDVFVQLAETALRDANKNAYRTGVKHLKAARRAAGQAGLDVAFTQHMATLRERHRRRPTLIAMLDKAKLP
jgi:hypothetical protein